jgi:large subunit ribosomal protein L17
MRHKRKRHHLSKPADQRLALLRTLATSLIKHDEIVTTLARAKALKELADKLVTLGKRGDLNAIRQASRYIYNHPTGAIMQSDKGRDIPETVLRRLFKKVAPRYEARQGGYTRLIKMPPRRGDAAPMALLQFVQEDAVLENA